MLEVTAGLNVPLTPPVALTMVPSGTAAPDQFAGSTHSLGSPPLPPTQVPSTAYADTTPRAVVASRTASECRSAIELRLPLVPSNRIFASATAPFSNRNESYVQFTRVARAL